MARREHAMAPDDADAYPASPAIEQESAMGQHPKCLSEPIRFGPFELRTTERRLSAEGRPLAIGARAFDVLLALVEQRGALVSAGQMLDRVWPDVVVEENNVQVQVSALRKALGAQAIATIPGRGYRLAIEVQAPAAQAQDTGQDTGW
jgi:DNA-binding winged helix-turn-helix (wHTH) protein